MSTERCRPISVSNTSTTSTSATTTSEEIKQGQKVQKNRSSIPISASLSILNTATIIQEHVKLISSDGFEFLIEKDAAFVSPTMKNMLSEAQQNTIHFPEINERDISDIPTFDIDPYMALELLMVADFLQC
nr:10115_t:CDS:2 [Entrophospora candida]